MKQSKGLLIVAVLAICGAGIQQPVQAQDTVLEAKPFTNQLASASGDWTSIFGSKEPDIRVSPNIRNESIRDAVKNLIGKADVSYEIDEDVPADSKVSLKADNISLTTAINVLIESAGIGCVVSTNQKNSETDGKRTVTARHHYHFTKKRTGPITMGMMPWIFNGRDLGSKLNVLGSTGVTLKSGDVNDIVSNALKSYSVQPNGAGTLLYNLRASEERSTFTCPHCHQQVTIIKKHIAPKCPTCGRTFQDDWKFCPVDGAKRPDDTGDWKFCPHCGKAVS